MYTYLSISDVIKKSKKINKSKIIKKNINKF